MGKINRFIKTAFTYLVGNIFSKLVTLILIPLYTNKLSSSQYGDYDVVSTLITLLVSLAFFQIWDGMFRMSFEYDSDDEKYRVIGICFKGYFIGIVVFMISYYIIYKFMGFSMFMLPCLFGVFLGLQYMYSFATRIFLKNKLFAFSGALNTFVLAVVNIVLILIFDFGVSSLYLAQIVGALVQIVIIEGNLHLISKVPWKECDLIRLKRILKFSIPLCIATVSYWLLSGYTKIVINRICGSSDNGLFAIANSLANMAVIVINVFQFAWNEMAYIMSKDLNRKKIYKKCLDLLFCTVWICCAGFTIFVSIIYPYYIGERFQASSVVVPYLMVGVSANAIAGFLGTLFMTEQSTLSIMSSTFAAASCNIIFSKMMTERYGLIGAVIVLTVSFVLLMCIRLIQVGVKMKVTISYSSILSIVPVMVAIGLYINHVGFIINMAYIISLLFIYYIIFTKISGFNINSFVNGIKERIRS